MSEWNENAKYILKTLERLEEKLDTHIQNYDDQLDKVKQNLLKIERDVAWHAKIAMAIAAFTGAVIGWFAKSHG